MTAQLELIWRTRSGGGGRTERKYLDFVINGQSLGELLQVGDMIGCLGWGKPEYESDMTQILLLKKPSPLETCRVTLYICAECGDIGCGAITAQVEKTSEHFVWSGFGYENYYDPSRLDLQEYTEIGPYLFNKTEYWQVVSRRDADIC